MGRQWPWSHNEKGLEGWEEFPQQGLGPGHTRNSASLRLRGIPAAIKWPRSLAGMRFSRFDPMPSCRAVYPCLASVLAWITCINAEPAEHRKATSLDLKEGAKGACQQVDARRSKRKSRQSGPWCTSLATSSAVVGQFWGQDGSSSCYTNTSDDDDMWLDDPLVMALFMFTQRVCTAVKMVIGSLPHQSLHQRQTNSQQSFLTSQDAITTEADSCGH